jgi:hypothetical protein
MAIQGSSVTEVIGRASPFSAAVGVKTVHVFLKRLFHGNDLHRLFSGMAKVMDEGTQCTDTLILHHPHGLGADHGDIGLSPEELNVGFILYTETQGQGSEVALRQRSR